MFLRMGRDKLFGTSTSEEGNTMRAGTPPALTDSTETILLEISTQLHPEQLMNYLGNLCEEVKRLGILQLKREKAFRC